MEKLPVHHCLPLRGITDQRSSTGADFPLFYSSLPQKCHSHELMSQKCLKIFIFFSIFFYRNNYSSTHQWHFCGKPDFYVCISIYFLFILCAFVFSAQEFQSNWLATDTGISLCYEHRNEWKKCKEKYVKYPTAAEICLVCLGGHLVSLSWGAAKCKCNLAQHLSLP